MKLLLGENEKADSSEIRTISGKEQEENLNVKIKTWKDLEARRKLKDRRSFLSRTEFERHPG